MMLRFEMEEEKPVWKRWVGGLVSVVILVVGAGVLLSQPSCTQLPPPTEQVVDPALLRTHVVKLSEEFAPRSYKYVDRLAACADYIAAHFEAAGGRVSRQRYRAQGRAYQNVIAAFGPAEGDLLVVGAHYDSCGDTPGADDNASGVAGLLELSTLLGKTELQQPVQLVAFTLEEPPFFRSGYMGSAQYVQKLQEDEVVVEAMLCLEMIGYFSDVKGSQRFPMGALKWIYPDAGNYIALIGSFGDRKLIADVKRAMRGATDLPVHSMSAPKSFPGVDYSDHQHFWNAGMIALMVTDTAFHRNPYYHHSLDTADRLDYERMAKVVLGVYEAVVDLTEE